VSTLPPMRDARSPHTPPPLQDAPKPLPCALPAPTKSTPAVKADADALATGGTGDWTAVGGNEADRVADLAATAFDAWLSSGAPGAAGTACTAANVGAYAVNVTTACKRVDGGKGAYALEFSVRYGCAPSAAADATKVKAVLRTIVAQPAAVEKADGSLVKPKAAPESTWLVSGSQSTRALVEKRTVKTLAGAPASAEEAAEDGPAERPLPAGAAGDARASAGAAAAVASIGAALSSALDAASSMDGRMGARSGMMAAPAGGDGWGARGGAGGATAAAMPGGGMLIISPMGGGMGSASPYGAAAADGAFGDALNALDSAPAASTADAGDAETQIFSATDAAPKVAASMAAKAAPKTTGAKEAGRGGGARRLAEA